MTNSDWWFVKKHLTLEEGYVPAKLLAEEVSYTHYVEEKIEEKANKLPVFDSMYYAHYEGSSSSSNYIWQFFQYLLTLKSLHVN